MADGTEQSVGPLKLLGFRAVREHFCILAGHLSTVLPCGLLEELQTHLTVCQLEQLQPALNNRGVSTFRGWSRILRDLRGPFSVLDVSTEAEAKLMAMTELCKTLVYNFRKNHSWTNYCTVDNTFVLAVAAARYTKHFILMNMPEPLLKLTTKWRQVLLQLEKHVHSVKVSCSLEPLQSENQSALLVLHRLLDHGQARRVKVCARCPHTLAWILRRRTSMAMETPEGSKEEDHGPASKRSRLDTGMGHREGAGVIDKMDRADDMEGGAAFDIKDGEVNDRGGSAMGRDGRRVDRFQMGDRESRGAADAVGNVEEVSCDLGDCLSDQGLSHMCPCRPIENLELEPCHEDCLPVLVSALPSFSSLRSLTLHSYMTLSQSSALDLTGALHELSKCPGAGLTELNLCTLPCPSLLERLLEACPRLLSLSAEVHTVAAHTTPLGAPTTQNHSKFPLQTLSISLNQWLTPGLLIHSLVMRCHRLRSLHVCGLRLQSGASYGRLLTVVSESCRSLRSLQLEDVNLSDSLEQILLLLKRCQLHNLNLKDCRLLEKWTNKEESLERLTIALANHRSLTTLGLAHNRIARHVPVLAQLFSGGPGTSLERVDLSSNFIQPVELLEFSHRLGALMPKRRLTLDLRRNPGDRDPDGWSVAVSSLAPYCHLLLKGWSSTDTMVDHISNM